MWGKNVMELLNIFKRRIRSDSGQGSVGGIRSSYVPLRLVFAELCITGGGEVEFGSGVWSSYYTSAGGGGGVDGWLAVGSGA
ncbi:hypothetical protein RJ639_025300 [Escallonia herrerae]|uniref:Uncharacterized protein n=1 Tax=Escallonia herrerae TaxID=1293975 RepID=A0AA88S2Q3_9ASTE|nr:hypothetical protein RJ639_025300 [Escallonia herrerae]